VVDGCESSLCEVSSGVPQGSILGPFLFLIYVNDLPDVVTHGTVALFADDAKLFRPIKSLNDQLNLNKDLESLLTWSRGWLMVFNAGKCYTMRFSISRNLLDFTYNLGTNNLKCVDQFVDLGIRVTSDLTWSEHINEIRGKAFRNLGYVKRTLGRNVSLEAKKLLYISLVRSVISYGTQVWNPYLRRDRMKLESIQRHATLYMLNYTDLSYVERLNEANLLPLSFLREVYDLTMFFGMIHNLLDVDLNRYFSIDHNLRRGRSELHAFGIVQRKYKHNHCAYFFNNRILETWHRLPVWIKNIQPSGLIQNCNAFKAALLKHYKMELGMVFDTNDLCTWVSWCNCYNCRN
jgi:hypothetical protein